MFDVALIVLVLMNSLNFVMVLPLNIYIHIDKLDVVLNLLYLDYFFLITLIDDHLQILLPKRKEQSTTKKLIT